MTIQNQVHQMEDKLKAQGRKYRGLSVLFPDGDQHLFVRKDWKYRTAIENLEKAFIQHPDAFKTFTNLNDEVVVSITKKLPHFYLV